MIQTTQKIYSKGIKVSYYRSFINWLRQQQKSLGLNTYQSSRLMLIGVNEQVTFCGFEGIFERAMQLYATLDRLYLISRYKLWQMDNIVTPGQLYKGYDKLDVLPMGYTTGDIDIHDIAVDNSGRVIFVCTLLNCLATVSQKNSCTPLWKAPFMSKVINQDRCHLNGFALGEEKVSACSQSDLVDGWHKRDVACAIDVVSNQVIVKGLSMPDSFRWYRDKLWLSNSGTDKFSYT